MCKRFYFVIVKVYEGGVDLEREYYQLLKEKYHNKENVVTELINLEAILHLPKGTEHFVSDVHGEFIAFDHVLRNGSGSVKEKLNDCFKGKEVNIQALATLIYYPEERLQLELEQKTVEEKEQFYRRVLSLLLEVVHYSSSKYTRSKVRKALPKRFAYIIEELLSESQQDVDKEAYFRAIIDKIIQLGQATALITDLCYLIQRFVVDHLHVVGDIYDRGPAPDFIMERLLAHHSVDIQWGNHDMVWIAAMAGSPLAMMNLLRISARYGNLDVIEDRYGINLRPLVDYSRHYYTPSKKFAPRLESKTTLSTKEQKDLNCVQQATAILQFKLEGQLIHRRPDFRMEDRLMLERINHDTHEITLQGNTYALVDFQAPTVDKKHPYQVSMEEEQLVDKLMDSLQSSEKLRRHMDFLMEKGSMYLCSNGNLLLHGCLPMHENGDLKSFRVGDQQYSGKELLDFFETQVRKSYENPKVSNDLATDMLWYLWAGELSSLFGKKAMTTFERYYIEDKKTHVEVKNPYYQLRNEERVCQQILREFQLPADTGHIINGHTPVKEKDGEDPIKAGGRLLVIDGGFSKPYQKKTGVAGYTLLSNSYGLQLVTHQPFKGVAEVVKNGTDILSTKRLVESVKERTTVKKTNIGQKLQKEMTALEELYKRYNQL